MKLGGAAIAMAVALMAANAGATSPGQGASDHHYTTRTHSAGRLEAGTIRSRTFSGPGAGVFAGVRGMARIQAGVQRMRSGFSAGLSATRHGTTAAEGSYTERNVGITTERVQPPADARTARKVELSVARYTGASGDATHTRYNSVSATVARRSARTSDGHLRLPITVRFARERGQN